MIVTPISPTGGVSQEEQAKGVKGIPLIGLIPILGMVPRGLDADAFEVSPNMPVAEARTRLHLPGRAVLTASSDAHWLDALASAYTVFELVTRSVSSMRQAVRDGNCEAVNSGPKTP